MRCNLRGEELFSSTVLENADSRVVYYQFIAALRQRIQDLRDTSLTHKFIRILRDSGLLLRCYTQNIDALEVREGLALDLEGELPKTRGPPYAEANDGDDSEGNGSEGCDVVPLHGTLRSLRCSLCSAECEWTKEASEIFLSGSAPGCAICRERSDRRQASGKRATATGSLRPNIVLYGQNHPQGSRIEEMIRRDSLACPDMLLIMGTSLKIRGVQALVKDLAKIVHQMEGGRVVFVNRTQPAASIWENVIDDHVMMDCDEWVKDLQDRCPGLLSTKAGNDNIDCGPSAAPRRTETLPEVDEEDRLWLEAFFD